MSTPEYEDEEQCCLCKGPLLHTRDPNDNMCLVCTDKCETVCLHMAHLSNVEPLPPKWERRKQKDPTTSVYMCTFWNEECCYGTPNILEVWKLHHEREQEQKQNQERNRNREPVERERVVYSGDQ